MNQCRKCGKDVIIISVIIISFTFFLFMEAKYNIIEEVGANLGTTKCYYSNTPPEQEYYYNPVFTQQVSCLNFREKYDYYKGVDTTFCMHGDSKGSQHYIVRLQGGEC